MVVCVARTAPSVVRQDQEFAVAPSRPERGRADATRHGEAASGAQDAA